MGGILYNIGGSTMQKKYSKLNKLIDSGLLSTKDHTLAITLDRKYLKNKKFTEAEEKQVIELFVKYKF